MARVIFLLRIACLLVMTVLLSQPVFFPKASIGFGVIGAANLKPNAGSASELVALVNQLRTANGLPPFKANAALMQAAQAHSQYQASIGSTTHTGSGGSSIKDRALAAGYGGGADVSVIENVYGGMGATPQNAVSWWRGDGPHLNTLLSTRHTDVGAGVAEAGGVVYFTLDVGSVVGGKAPTAGSPTQAVSGTLPASSQLLDSSAPAFNPVVTASPGADGSLVHLVQPGQTLWTIAAAYQVPLPELLQINGFSESTLIFPGDKVLVKKAEVDKETPLTASPEIEKTNQVTGVAQPAPLETAGPSPAPTQSVISASTSASLSTPEILSDVDSNEDMGKIIWIASAVLLIAGAALFVVGKLIDRKNHVG